MKKFVLGLVLGIAISSASIVYADETIQATVFPATFSFYGNGRQLDDGYSVLNYNNHVYVPVRFVAENMGGYVNYDNNTNKISIYSNPTDHLTIEDPNNNYVSLGNITVTKAGDKTKVSGYIEVLLPGTNMVGANLSFYDSQGNQLGFVVINGNVGPGVQRFEATGDGDFANYQSVKLNIGYLNGVVGRVPK